MLNTIRDGFLPFVQNIWNLLLKSGNITANKLIFGLLIGKNCHQKREGVFMYRIAVLANGQSRGEQLALWIENFCRERGLFPLIKLYENFESFLGTVNDFKPSCAVIALDGVEGLNASQRLKALCPDCGLIWCSDLDFSLEAYRIRTDYFIKGDISGAELFEGLSLLMNCRCTKCG